MQVLNFSIPSISDSAIRRVSDQVAEIEAIFSHFFFFTCFLFFWLDADGIMSRKMLIDGEVEGAQQFDYDLFVIGAGSGGVRASRTSANFGAKVCIPHHQIGIYLVV